MIKQMMNFILNIQLVQIVLPWNKKIEDKKALQKAKNLFTSLKTNPNSVLFSEEKIDARLLKKFKKSRYAKNSLLVKLIFLADKKLDD